MTPAAPLTRTTATSPPTTGRRHRRVVVRAAVAAGLVAAAVLLIVHGGADAAQLAAAVHRSPMPAPLLVVGGCAVLVCLFVPRTVLALAAGGLLGGCAGTLWTVAGVTLGALAAYAIGGFLGGDVLAAPRRGRAANLDRLVSARGPWAVAAARMLPVVHFGAANYLFGTTSVRLPAYLAGTAAGIVPGTAAYAALGAAMAAGDPAGTAAASAAVIALSGLGVAGSALLIRLAADRAVAVDPRGPRAQARSGSE